MWNEIGASGATAMIGLLEKNDSLTDLKLAGNNIPCQLLGQIGIGQQLPKFSIIFFTGRFRPTLSFNGLYRNCKRRTTRCNQTNGSCCVLDSLLQENRTSQSMPEDCTDTPNHRAVIVSRLLVILLNFHAVLCTSATPHIVVLTISSTFVALIGKNLIISYEN